MYNFLLTTPYTKLINVFIIFAEKRVTIMNKNIK